MGSTPPPDDSTARSPKEVTIDELERVAGQARAAGRTVVWTNGCFEILHAGHIKFLTRAATLGGALVVGINSDASVRELKGEGHPLSPAWQRKLVLSAVECVDYVCVFEGRNCADILRALRPEVYAKGLRHFHAGIDPEERRAIEEYGGCVALIAGDPVMSTRAIVQRISGGNSGRE